MFEFLNEFFLHNFWCSMLWNLKLWTLFKVVFTHYTATFRLKVAWILYLDADVKIQKINCKNTNKENSCDFIKASTLMCEHSNKN